MTARQRVLRIALAALAASLVAPEAHAASLTIETGSFLVRKLGPLKTTSSRTYAPTSGSLVKVGTAMVTS